MQRIAILASGSGSNARNLMDYFSQSSEISVKLLASNKTDAGALKHAADMGLNTLTFSKSDLDSGELLRELLQDKVDFVVLAGFLLKIPRSFIQAFKNRIINIHPSLLPKYGGKGMYGKHVHEAVFNNKETETGISIHLVNEVYDEGRILFQEKIALNNETVESIENKVRNLEMRHLPKVVEEYILNYSNEV